MRTTQAIAQSAGAHYPTARANSQNDVTNDKLQFSKHMDSHVRRRSIFNLAVEIVLLFPFLTYAVTEILVCFFWSLILRLFHDLCSLVLDGFYSGMKTQQVPLNDENSRQNDALVKSQLHKETDSPGAKPARDRDFYSSTKSSEKLSSFKKTSETRNSLQTKEESQTKQSLNTKENKEERTPRLITKQWVTREIIWKVDRDTANIREYEALLHDHSDAEGKREKKDVYSREEITTPNLEDGGGQASEWDPRQENTFNCNLRADRKDYESKRVKGSCSPHVQVCPLSNLNAVSCDSTKENVEGFKQADMSISDRSGVSDEKSLAGTLVFSCAATGTPVKHRPVSVTLETGETQASTDTATTSNRANGAKLVQKDTSHTGLSNSPLEGPLRDRHTKEAEVTMSATVDSHQSYGTFVVRKAKGCGALGKFNAPHHLGMQSENQKRVKATSSQPKLRTEQVKHPRLRFARASRRSVLRNSTMPLL